MLKVAQVCIGKFHHFDLAKQLYKRGLLERFYTGYPAFKLHGQQLPMEKTTTFPWLMGLRMGLPRYGILPRWCDGTLHRWVQESLDAHVAATLPECNVLFALSGSGLRAGRVIKLRGGHYICDRGSSHIRYQDDILREEFLRLDDSFSGVDPKIMEKEQEEYESADLITVPSEFVYRSFIELGVPASKLRKVPYGVDLRTFEKVGEPANHTFDVLFVGQVGFRKGVPDLLAAFGNLKHPGKRLRIVGNIQPEMKRFLQKSPPAKNVEFLGHIPQAQLKQIMSRSHVMVLPSIEEGLALVQAQAMACGCPVIGTLHAGAEDLFTDGVEGFIVPPREPKAIADRLQWLADDSDKRLTMSEAALRKVQSIGGWDRYGDMMEEVLRDLVGSPIQRQATGQA